MEFSRLIPNFVQVADFPPQVVDAFADRVPAEILPFWGEQGLGTFADGFLKVIDPSFYLAKLGDCLPTGFVPLFATAFGDVIACDGDGVFDVQYRYGRVTGLGYDLEGFADFSAEREYQEMFLASSPYVEAVAAHGPLAYDECFCFTPLLALGGPERVENLTKGDLVAHVQLITELTGGIVWP